MAIRPGQNGEGALWAMAGTRGPLRTPTAVPLPELRILQKAADPQDSLLHAEDGLITASYKILGP